MPLFVRDAEVDRLAERLALLRRVSKTEAGRSALQHELEREEAQPTLVERGLDYGRALRARARPGQAGKSDKAFIDSLYGDD